MPHTEASFVVIYLLNIFIAAILLASNSELFEDVDILVLYAYILKSLGWKFSSCLHTLLKSYIKISFLHDN